MKPVRSILLALAALCFLFAAFNLFHSRVNLVALGLFLLALAELLPEI
jgi:hypothetical protein